MRRYVLSQLRHRPGRAVALGVGILVAAVSFTLLTAAAATSELRIRGDVEASFRAAYDILVRPADSFSALERERALVRANHLGGLYGGIAHEQYESVRRIPGVEVAAPIANVGYILPYAEIPVLVDDVLDGADTHLFRVRLTWVADRGLSRYPVGDRYVYVTSRNPFVALGEGRREVPPHRGELHEVVPGKDAPLPVCSRFGYDLTGLPRPELQGLAHPPGLHCFSTVTPEVTQGLAPGEVGAVATLHPPILLSAIDPEQEAALVGLDGAITSGRYLRPGDRHAAAEVAQEPAPTHVDLVPVIVSERTYVDARLEARIERLAVPDTVQAPVVLADHERAYDWLVGLPGETVATRTIDPEPVYQGLLQGLAGQPGWPHVVNGYWQAADVSYGRADGGDVALTPRTTTNGPATWVVPRHPGGLAPPGSEDVQFRTLDVFGALAGVDSDDAGNDYLRGAGVRVVGTFDPELLPGFDPLSAVPLETYEPPIAAPSDEASAMALGGRPLLPSMNLGGYVQQPPLMLTTLEAAAAFFDDEHYERSSTDLPISAIRVRVAGVEGPDAVSLERIRRVAEAIVDRTGLTVDVTAGSSPAPVRVALPPGAYGRPELVLEEGWVQKGVAVAVLTATDRKSAVLFVLILVICTTFLANGALASVRTRRSEIATLRAIGWTRWQVARATLGELLLVGLGAGVAGSAVAGVAVVAFDLAFPLPRIALVTPVALLLAAAAGTVPALAAARVAPVRGLGGPGSTRMTRAPVRGLAGMAARMLLRVPGRTLAGVSGLALAVAALVILLAVAIGFQGLLTGTLLGDALAVRVRPVDYATAGLALLLGAASVADTLYIGLRERAADFVTLRTTGWHDWLLTRLGCGRRRCSACSARRRAWCWGSPSPPPSAAGSPRSRSPWHWPRRLGASSSPWPPACCPSVPFPARLRPRCSRRNDDGCTSPADRRREDVPAGAPARGPGPGWGLLCVRRG